jgi:uncharacterized membrane protein
METPHKAQQASSPLAPTNHTNGINLLEHLHFPKFKHESHPSIINVNKVADEQLTVGQKVADTVAAGMGSWSFIIILGVVLAAWIVINSIQLLAKPFDPYPYILLNLTLSFLAAFSAPFIMISQNRQEQKDRLAAQNDYLTNIKAEEEARHVIEHLDHQDTLTIQIMQHLEKQSQRIDEQEQLILQLLQEVKQQHHLFQEQREILSALQAHPGPLPDDSEQSTTQESEN